MKVNHCEECKNWLFIETKDIKKIRNESCNKGHKPRFYKPYSGLDQNWGWKKRCKDFELDDHVQIIKF